MSPEPSHLWDWPRFLTQPAPRQPAIFIAGDCESTMETLFGATVGELERQALEDAREKGMTLLFPGDRVSASSVVIDDIGDDPFALEPDQRAALAYLTVTRPSGETKALEPILVLPKGNMLAANVGDTIAQLRERLVSIDDASDLAALGARLQEEKANFERTLNGLRPEKETQGLLGGLEIALALAAFDRLLNLGTYYGFQQGRLEAEQKMKTPALERLTRLAADRLSQVKATATRTKWRDAAIAYAAEECRRDPAISSSALARFILKANSAPTENSSPKENSGKRFGDLPKEEHLIELVREWRREGRLPRRM